MPKGPLLPPLCPQPFNFIFPFAVYFASSTFSLFPLFLSFLCFGSSVPLVHHVASRVSYHMMQDDEWRDAQHSSVRAAAPSTRSVRGGLLIFFVREYIKCKAETARYYVEDRSSSQRKL